MDTKTFNEFRKMLDQTPVMGKMFNFWCNALLRCPDAKELGFKDAHIVERAVAMAMCSVIAQVKEESEAKNEMQGYDILISLSEPYHYIYKIGDSFKGESISAFPALIPPKSTLIM